MTEPVIIKRSALNQKRFNSERRFRAYGIAAIAATALFLGFLLLDILIKALPAFTATHLVLPVAVEKSEDVSKIDFQAAAREALRGQFPDVSSRGDKKKLNGLLSTGATDELRQSVVANPALAGTNVSTRLLLADEADLFIKGVNSSQVDEKQQAWIKSLQDKGLIERSIAWNFFTSGDSREPEQAGIRGALVGSVLTILVTLSLALPLGVAAALYLEEFASRSKLTEIIEVNINNLAAVPSIIFGLLGLAVFLNVFGLPRSAPLVGGLVLALLVLPTIIIASRAALRSVPPSIKEAALGVGASHQQAVFHHVLPLALPGILTGTILGVSRALGETAPLLLIGMIAFIADVPSRLTDAATVMPVQVFLWSDLPEAAFKSRTAAAIILLLVVLFFFNALAIYLRKKFERRW